MPQASPPPALPSASAVPASRVPFELPPWPVGSASNVREWGLDVGTVETFDPIGRAVLISERLPRRWSGTYRSFADAAAVPVVLEIDAVTPMGQMVDLRGRLSLGDIVSPVQGNINAKSDQLDLLLLADQLGADLEPGGEFQGLQGLSLSGWRAPRLISPGGRLQLQPQAASPGDGPSIRGLW